MADYIVKDTELTSVANAIRTAGGTSSLLTFPNGFANAINNISGSGGSSDFSTAEVTVTFGSASNTYMQGACILEDGGVDYLDISYPISSNTTSVIPAVLYKGEGSVMIQTAGTVTVTGNIQQMSPSAYLITGDCTITIS